MTAHTILLSLSYNVAFHQDATVHYDVFEKNKMIPEAFSSETEVI